VEEHLHQGSRVDPDLVGEIAQASAADSLITWPLPRGTCTPPIDGACHVVES